MLQSIVWKYFVKLIPALHYLRREESAPAFIILFFFFFSVMGYSPALLANEKVVLNQLKDIRVWKDPAKTRVVLDFTHRIQYKLSTVKNPDRLIVDIEKVQTRINPDKIDLKQGVVNAIHLSWQEPAVIHLVFDLDRLAQSTHFTLPPNQQYSHRLVLDLVPISAELASIAPSVSLNAGKVVVAIDAGHGGEDPGARGKFGTQEKQVVLAIAKKLKTELQALPGIRPVLTREEDYFIALKERTKIAREKYRADLFISIHADAWQEASARGASVFMLSSKGASSTLARSLANSENSSDLIGGVEIQDKMLNQVLFDLAMNGTLEHSRRFGDLLIDSFKRTTELHKREVEEAGFLVLKSPDMPSVLIETGFISNPKEEQKLRDATYQLKLAKAIAEAVDRYFSIYAPPNTYYAKAKKNALRLHRVTEGETLKGIAMKYKASTSSLKKLNRLSNDKIKSGDLLTIPWF